ncbi:hypothetical protein Y590_21950 [Methylobacterium sp. AMS5]|nr:hypothetical protein Y590_21950 [Methylobacterium sp. AMS5]
MARLSLVPTQGAGVLPSRRANPPASGFLTGGGETAIDAFAAAA